MTLQLAGLQPQSCVFKICVSSAVTNEAACPANLCKPLSLASFAMNARMYTACAKKGYDYIGCLTGDYPCCRLLLVVAQR